MFLQEMCSLLQAKQPLLLMEIVSGRQEFVEIIDSSDEEDTELKRDNGKGMALIYNSVTVNNDYRPNFQ